MNDTCNGEMTTLLKMPVAIGSVRPGGQQATLTSKPNCSPATFSAANL
jgi:hypothetical protein